MPKQKRGCPKVLCYFAVESVTSSSANIIVTRVRDQRTSTEERFRRELLGTMPPQLIVADSPVRQVARGTPYNHCFRQGRQIRTLVGKEIMTKYEGIHNSMLVFRQKPLFLHFNLFSERISLQPKKLLFQHKLYISYPSAHRLSQAPRTWTWGGFTV